MVAPVQFQRLIFTWQPHYTMAYLQPEGRFMVCFPEVE